MPSRRHQPEPPIPPPIIPIAGPPSPLATPSILRQIFLYSNDDTLAQCMRTTQLFYHVAAPILYHEISCPGVNLGALILGHDRPTRLRITRASALSINLKNDLLRHIRVLELDRHDFHGGCDAICHLPRLQTFRIRPRMRCGCPVTNTYLCASERWFGPHCGWTTARADKVVLACYSGLIVLNALNNIHSVIHSASTLTVTVSPDSQGCSFYFASSIRECLEESPRPLDLRIIIAPPATTHIEGDGTDETGDPWMSHEKASFYHASTESVTADILIGFCHELVSPKYATTIYLIHGNEFRSADDLKQFRQLPSLVEVEAGVRDDFKDTSADQRPKFAFKTRQDYVNEGFTDEIDPLQLASWRRIEALRPMETLPAVSGCTTGNSGGAGQ